MTGVLLVLFLGLLSAGAFGEDSNAGGVAALFFLGLIAFGAYNAFSERGITSFEGELEQDPGPSSCLACSGPLSAGSRFCPLCGSRVR